MTPEIKKTIEEKMILKIERKIEERVIQKMTSSSETRLTASIIKLRTKGFTNAEISDILGLSDDELKLI